MTEPLRLDLLVACPLEHAFDVWATRIDTWWPRDHTASGEPGARVVLDRRVGGRIYEVTADGTEHEWGEVTAWEPPHRLAYLWHLRTDRASATDVEIRFTSCPDGTKVEIEHAGWERLGDAADAWRERNHGGWTTLLHFVAAATHPERSQPWLREPRTTPGS
jgi:uncharacterized protein YndB with AHSA1/START domain